MLDFEWTIREQAIVLGIFVLAVGIKKYPLILNGLRKFQNTFKPKT